MHNETILLTKEPDDIFYSIEGEGIHLGQPKVFIRTQICPFTCDFCDSMSTWKRKDGVERTFAQIMAKILELGQGRFTKDVPIHFELTGGDPAVQAKKLKLLITYLRSVWPNAKFTLQTSGGIYNDEVESLIYNYIDHVSFDYKNPKHGIPFKIPLDIIREGDEVKMLIDDEESYIFVRDFIRNHKMAGKYVITCITDYKDPDNLIEKHLNNLRGFIERATTDPLFDLSNVQIFPRLHSLLWLTKKGV